MAVYINGASVISPQNTFGSNHFPDEIRTPDPSGRLLCIEPVYRDFIDPMTSRRMSRIVKMGVCSAIKCLNDTGIDVPDAIIAGTGLGCLEDTEKFLSSIFANEEKLLNPTPFIQSTHNTVAGAIALATKCHNYNTTYTHRSFSFENAIADALLLLEDNPALNILAGGFDENTHSLFEITSRMGLWENAFPGEGVAFFMLSGTKGDKAFAKLNAVTTFHRTGKNTNIPEALSGFLKSSGIPESEIDLVVLGINENVVADSIYAELMGIFPGKSSIGYKHLCGEYDTSSAFALWLSSIILKTGIIPGHFQPHLNPPKRIEKILIYNHFHGSDHSLYLLEKC